MAFPTHIVAVGGLINNSEGKILLDKASQKGLGIPGRASRDRGRFDKCIKEGG